MKKTNKKTHLVRSYYRTPESVLQNLVEGVSASLTLDGKIELNFYHLELKIPEYTIQYVDDTGSVIESQDHYDRTSEKTPTFVRVITNRVRIPYETAIEFEQQLSVFISRLEDMQDFLDDLDSEDYDELYETEAELFADSLNTIDIDAKEDSDPDQDLQKRTTKKAKSRAKHGSKPKSKR
ncbi:MAG: hypothetical protein K5657_05200 [Desulfovibrio sp.]|nr:hypothetical protein [Desulfovibrio sp.]